jgi:Uma2 family endonuclease
MSASTLISLEEYLRTSYRPDCDFVDGEVLERNVGKRRHAYAQGKIASWFDRHQDILNLASLPELRMQVCLGKIRIPDVVICELPLPDEEVFTLTPYLCVEVMSPEDTTRSMQDRLDDYLAFGVPNVWVIDPWKHCGWSVTASGWAAEPEVMRTSDGRVAMPLAEVLLP